MLSVVAGVPPCIPYTDVPPTYEECVRFSPSNGQINMVSARVSDKTVCG